MTIDQLLQIHTETCNQARSIMEAKNHDYTSGSEDPFANFRAALVLGVQPEIGILLRSMDKFKRIETFVNKGTLHVENESADDAISDIINYMILLKGLIAERKTNL